MDSRPIGVFDSGLGGLSILKELHRELPQENFIFLADQLNIPYGEKKAEEIIEITSRITEYLLEHKIKLLVIACNTATCYAIDTLREKYNIEIVGTVPAIKVAAENSKTGTIACISTPATSQSETIAQLIKLYCRDLSVINIGCKNLEEVVETGNLNNKSTETLLEHYLSEVTKSNADQLVLGCTHYPFLRKQIKKIVGPGVAVIDSGVSIAHRVKYILETNNLKATSNNPGQTEYLTTGDSKRFSSITNTLLNISVQAKEVSL